MKIIKWIAILSFTVLSIVILYWVGFAILFSYGAGSGGTGSFERYEFKGNGANAKKVFEKTFEKEDIIIRDSVIDENHDRTIDEHLIIINLKENNTEYIIDFPNNNNDFYFYLIYIDGKINDDFGWFSFEKHKKLKAFEEVIIKPLSKKFKRVEE
ncbi:hypothetical protein IUY40_13950 [Flavobacterium sp. ALJ2]|uniref:hypothetical protein n=1 Tax=Flavobacterium sp. ALJ2 TaxID=2786960 RepID=UPI0018A0424E|nr:hypothetical protein [Flavobacterium sp. ALJ2]MBF7092635.1 hypothetical protein [Flavobacterium sp. ALJ2]